MTVQFLSPRSHSSTPLVDCPLISSLRALTRFISTRTSPSTSKPYSAPRRATWAAYALATSVFVGIHPVLTHVPPNLWRSIMATVIPAAENRAAKDGPAWPVPMIMASKWCDTMHLLSGRSQFQEESLQLLQIPPPAKVVLIGPPTDRSVGASQRRAACHPREGSYPREGLRRLPRICD